jgi:hypothetical protein
VRSLLKLFFLFLLATCFSFREGTPQNVPKPKGKIVKFTNLECNAVMEYLTDIWKVNEASCYENKRLVGYQLINLIQKEGCFIGKPFNVISRYLGKPDFVGYGGIEYFVVNHDWLLGGDTNSAIVFDVNKDSTINGVGFMSSSTEE